MFLHAGFAHFAGNMLFLWIFGDNVEDRLGHVGYALFYLLGGVVAALAHVAASPASLVPTVGASGAIAAVMGAYMLLYPGAHVQSLVLLGLFVRVVSVPAVIWLGIWFVFQIVAGAQSSSVPGQGGVAWWAHAGGFVFGAVAVIVFGLRGTRGGDGALAVADAPDTVFYDGGCALCHRSVRFLVVRDRDGSRFRFAPIGGARFRAELSDEARAALPDAIAVRTADGRLLVRSAAAIRLAERLGGASRAVARVLALVPVSLRDRLYDSIARSRYRVFGRVGDACPVISASLRERFDLRP